MSSSLLLGKIQLVQLPPESIRDLAALLHPMLKPAAATTRGKITSGQLLELAERKELQLWLAGEEGEPPLAVCATELVNYPGHRGCVILMIAGREMHRWAHLISEIEEWAKMEGCRTIEIQGRRGWARVFPGYAPLYTVIEKELLDG